MEGAEPPPDKQESFPPPRKSKGKTWEGVSVEHAALLAIPAEQKPDLRGLASFLMGRLARSLLASPSSREEVRQQKYALLGDCPLQGAATEDSIPSLVPGPFTAGPGASLAGSLPGRDKASWVDQVSQKVEERQGKAAW